MVGFDGSWYPKPSYQPELVGIKDQLALPDDVSEHRRCAVDRRQGQSLGRGDVVVRLAVEVGVAGDDQAVIAT